ncbi:MAG TPA: hypothetical protein VMZ53_12220 [Kofleriaceae bacterium]|nr:hypothetical protein [Kofleriaceae bacterium]
MREGYTLWQIAAMRILVALLMIVASTVAAHADAPAHDFIDDARALLVVGACAEGKAPETVKADVVEAHCKKVRKVQDDYKTSWVTPASEWMATNVPKTVSKTVVYPFAGGDLSTALTVYPDADEITTLSLEPAGDPRALGKLNDKQLKAALKVVETELGSLYKSNFSVTMNMIGAMRGGQLPTQLIFSLSALAIHGYEPVSVKYFKLDKDGAIHYLTDDDLAAIDKIKNVGKHNQELANVELVFQKKGGKKQQTYRHIMANLDDNHLKKDPSALAHLEKKGHVAGMTKAASYLLSFTGFDTIRKYIIDHVDWMISDTTGLPPKYGTPAGFEYEVWGVWGTPNMKAAYGIQGDWKALFKQQTKRELKFRFGYPDMKLNGHIVIMKRKS